MFKKILSFLILVGCCHSAISHNKNKSCGHLLRELADSQSKFVYCVTNHSVPVALCVGCKSLHANMYNAYQTLLSIKNCSNIYFNTDRINIVSTTQEVLTYMWNKANCDDCFRGNHTVRYEELWNTFDGCLSHHPLSGCTDCKIDYLTLNNFYLEMDKANKGRVCFDLQDSMNRTRLKWSDELKCCQREVKTTIFLITVCLVVILPLCIFYSTAVVLTKRREAEHGVINHLTPELEDPAPSTSALITAAVLSTPQETLSEVQAQNEKLADLMEVPQTKALLNLSDSDDDKPILDG
ncbi:osteopetrosis-associated transmembrane protein 1 [Drosophila tropicalis]|uniref:osteopetrosis-associated transmembrane protein 1 n=1 Tax=Drosophila tropicalis TaxID=46794 RepID=UPI0035ABB557